MAEAKKTATKSRGKKRKREIPNTGKVYISATFNNTLITITDPEGNTICWGSCGTAGFKGTRKATSFAASTAARKIAERALGLGVQSVAVFVKGPGSGRNAAVKSLRGAGLGITSITDTTPIPHNGCRPRNRRRV